MEVIMGTGTVDINVATGVELKEVDGMNVVTCTPLTLVTTGTGVVATGIGEKEIEVVTSIIVVVNTLDCGPSAELVSATLLNVDSGPLSSS